VKSAPPASTFSDRDPSRDRQHFDGNQTIALGAHPAAVRQARARRRNREGRVARSLGVITMPAPISPPIPLRSGHSLRY
jgi:hypothetical protein